MSGSLMRIARLHWLNALGVCSGQGAARNGLRRLVRRNSCSMGGTS